MERESLNTVWDRNAALNRLLGDEMLLHRMLAMFQQCAEQSISDLSIAIEEQNYSHVRALAHKLKGSASAIGAVKIMQDAISIEHAAQNEDTETIRITFSELESDMTDILQILTDYLTTNSS